MYEQSDGVTMGSSLQPVFANVTMTECEKINYEKLTENKFVKLQARYTDDTLLFRKGRDRNFIQ